jgi:chlorobactene glucosyltransferase
LFTAPVIKSSAAEIMSKEMVSVLVPARNEENNILKCLNGILNQDYKNIEIIVLDDHSTDKTYDLVKSIESEKIKLIKGKELPKNWLGKNWACHQLAQNANGGYLLFIDADVEVKPQVISSAVFEIQQSNASLISIFPTQKIMSFGEHLIVPLMNWLLLTFLPLKFVYKLKYNAFVAANGQFMFWKSDDYFKVGDHEIVKNKVVEDMELARLIKKSNLKVKTLLGGDLVYCKMYNSFKEAYAGFQKNFYAGFTVSPVFFLLIISFLFFVFTSPIFIVQENLISAVPLLMVIISRASVSIKSRQNWLLHLLIHPIQMLLMLWIGIVSAVKFKTNSIVWKDRKI